MPQLTNMFENLMYLLTVRRRFTPFRAEPSLGSSLFIAEILKTETGEPSALSVPW